VPVLEACTTFVLCFAIALLFSYALLASLFLYINNFYSRRLDEELRETSETAK